MPTDPPDRAALVTANRGRAYRWVNHYRPRAAAAGLDMEDVEQEAMTGLCLAAESWDPAKGPFGHWASVWVKNRILAMFASLPRRPRTVAGQDLAELPDRPDGP